MSLLKRISYPSVRRSATTYVMHENTVVPDPYDWLEQPNAEETKSFVTEQNKVFKEAMSPFDDKKESLKKKLTDLRSYARFGCPNRGRDDNEYYYYHNPGLLNQSRLMRIRGGSLDETKSKLSEQAEVFIDPNTLAEDGTSALGSCGWSVSRRYFAHGVCEKGSDWNTVYIKDAETNKMLPDVIKWVKYSGISWYQCPKTKKDVGFFYTRYPALDETVDKGTETDKAENAQTFFHRIGESQDQDVLVLRDPEHPEWLTGVGVTDDMQYLIGSFSNGCEKENLLWLARIPESFVEKTPSETEWKWIKLCNDWNAEWDLLANEGNKFWFKTTLNTPGNSVVTFELDEGAGTCDKNTLKTETVKVVVPEREFPLEGAYIVGKNIILNYLENVKNLLYIAHLDTPTDNKKIEMPISSLVGLACRRDSPFVAVKLSSFVLPGRSYYFNLALDGSSPLPPTLTQWQDEGPEGFNGDDFEVAQHFYKSPAGERKVPMFVCRRNDVEFDGDRPVLATAYGGFNISYTPAFSVGAYVWMKYFSGTFVVMNIRGGGEFGSTWHEEGKAKTKMNCYLDVIAGAEYLQKDLKVTNPKKLGFMGGSNGGTCVGAVFNQAPHLFGAGVCQVGVMDLFKFHKLGIGHAWKSDFCDPDTEDGFRYIQKYSPIQNIRAQVQYPPILIATGDHDDRVSPLHSYKYAATLQQVSPDFGGPFLLRVDVNAGHGGGKSLTKVIDEQADTYSFLSLALNAPMNE